MDNKLYVETELDLDNLADVLINKLGTYDLCQFVQALEVRAENWAFTELMKDYFTERSVENDLTFPDED